MLRIVACLWNLQQERMRTLNTGPDLAPPRSVAAPATDAPHSPSVFERSHLVASPVLGFRYSGWSARSSIMSRRLRSLWRKLLTPRLVVTR